VEVTGDERIDSGEIIHNENVVFNNTDNVRVFGFVNPKTRKKSTIKGNHKIEDNFDGKLKIENINFIPQIEEQSIVRGDNMRGEIELSEVIFHDIDATAIDVDMEPTGIVNITKSVFFTQTQNEHIYNKTIEIKGTGGGAVNIDNSIIECINGGGVEISGVQAIQIVNNNMRECTRSFKTEEVYGCLTIDFLDNRTLTIRDNLFSNQVNYNLTQNEYLHGNTTAIHSNILMWTNFTIRAFYVNPEITNIVDNTHEGGTLVRTVVVGVESNVLTSIDQTSIRKININNYGPAVYRETMFKTLAGESNILMECSMGCYYIYIVVVVVVVVFCGGSCVGCLVVVVDFFTRRRYQKGPLLMNLDIVKNSLYKDIVYSLVGQDDNETSDMGNGDRIIL